MTAQYDGLVDMPPVKPLREEPKKAFPFEANREYKEIGYCWFATGDFITFVHTSPCTASVASTLDMNGWEIYTQPTSIYTKFFNVGKESYVVTYRRKNRG